MGSLSMPYQLRLPNIHGLISNANEFLLKYIYDMAI